MTKTTIELNRHARSWSGWGRLFEKYSQESPAVMDALTDWSMKNVGKHIYKHRHFRAEENVSAEPTFVKTDISDKREVHLCDSVDYLEIYYQ